MSKQTPTPPVRFHRWLDFEGDTIAYTFNPIATLNRIRLTWLLLLPTIFTAIFLDPRALLAGAGLMLAVRYLAVERGRFIRRDVGYRVRDEDEPFEALAKSQKMAHQRLKNTTSDFHRTRYRELSHAAQPVWDAFLTRNLEKGEYAALKLRAATEASALASEFDEFSAALLEHKALAPSSSEYGARLEALTDSATRRRESAEIYNQLQTEYTRALTSSYES